MTTEQLIKSNRKIGEALYINRTQKIGINNSILIQKN